MFCLTINLKIKRYKKLLFNIKKAIKQKLEL